MSADPSRKPAIAPLAPYTARNAAGTNEMTNVPLPLMKHRPAREESATNNRAGRLSSWGNRRSTPTAGCVSDTSKELVLSDCLSDEAGLEAGVAATAI
eukprot:439850-Prymnesium_polylepis.3